MSNWQNRLDKRFTRDDGKKDYCTCSPDVLFGLDIGEACRLHDWRIENRSMASRRAVDQRFKQDIQTIARMDGKRVQGFIISWVYYLGVLLFGETEW